MACSNNKVEFYLLCGSFKCDEDYLKLGLYSSLDEAVFHYLIYHGTDGIKLNSFINKEWRYEKSVEAFHCLFIQPLVLGGTNLPLPYTIYTINEHEKVLMKFNITSNVMPCITDMKNLDKDEAVPDFDFVYPGNKSLNAFNFS